MLTFEKALSEIAAHLDLDADALLAYTWEDNIPGSCKDEHDPPPCSDPYAIPYTADGKLLYALVRALKPRRVLESGTSYGGSANHIATALRKNGFGLLTTVDIDPSAGGHIFMHLQGWVYSVPGMGIAEFIGRYSGNPFAFIHEDASHEVDSVSAVYCALGKLLAPGGVIVSHDTASAARQNIQDGITQCGYKMPPCYLYEGSPCGFSVMRR